MIACFGIAGAILWIDSPIRYPAEVSGWLAHHWAEPITTTYFLRNLFFLDHHLNVPTWTLRAELVCSLALPFVFLVYHFGRVTSRAAMLLGLMIWSLLGSGNLCAWLFMFYLGLLIPLVGPPLTAWWANSNRAAGWVAGLSALVLCAGMQFYSRYGRWGNLLEAVAASIFISVLLFGYELRAYKFFDLRLTRFYGRISFSFYLYHMVCLYFVFKLGMRVFPATTMRDWFVVSSFVLLLISTGVATILAYLSHRCVERPSIDFSKRLCRIIESRFTFRSNTSLAAESARVASPEVTGNSR